jgi:hypothetical protein
MNDEQTPSVEEIKERLKVEKIEVEEEVTKEKTQADIAAELKSLGQQFAETLRTAWYSQERYEVEAEIREGMQSFASEVDKVIRETKKSQAADRAKVEATEIKGRVESSDLGNRARVGVVQGLQWLSEELGKLAQQFTPTEKASTDVEAGEEAE